MKRTLAVPPCRHRYPDDEWKTGPAPIPRKSSIASAEIFDRSARRVKSAITGCIAPPMHFHACGYRVPRLPVTGFPGSSGL